MIKRTLAQAGLSLVELMVALAIGSFLLLGLVNVFLSSNEAAQLELSMARVQDAGRSGLELLSEDLRNARYTGCNSVAGTVTVMATGESFEGVRGYELRTDSGMGSWSPALPTKLQSPSPAASARPGSDLLNVQLAINTGASLQGNVTPTSTAIPLVDNVNCGIEQNDLVIVSSCVTAHLMRVTNAQTCDATAATNATTLEFDNTGNSITSIQPGYNTDSEVMRYEDVSWYVRDTGRDRDGYDVFALYRLSNGVEQEMIEGVETLQMLYGQRTDSGGTRFVSARNSSLDFDQVVSVRVAILVQSFSPVRDSDDAQSYLLLDETLDASSTTVRHSGGRGMRRVFQTTTILRNTAFDL